MIQALFYQREHENEQFGARDASRSYAIGVDGGGSKTLAVVVDAQGNERGRGIAGSANYATVGIDQAVRQIHSAVEEAARAASCSLPLSAAWLGLAGIDRPGDNEILLPHLRSVAEFILLTNDAELVLSALDDAVGIALIAGTGSIALGRDAHGTVTRKGGWGYIIGDEGSGYDIGRRCLQAVSRAVDGRGQMTALVGLLLQHWNLTDASDIIGKVYPDPGKAAIASLSAPVFRAARAADEIASEIVQSAADELALAAVAVRNTLDFPSEEVSLALGGGLLLHEADFRAQVLRGIGKELSIRQVVLVEEPALSAARGLSSWHERKPEHMRNYTGEMTLEEQAGQVLMAGFSGSTPSQEIIDLIQHYHVGNIILFSRNVRDARQVFELTRSLQQIAREAGQRYPLFIAIDQENGIVQRLGEATTIFPGNMALGAIGSEEIAYEVARATGRELKTLGINMNLAPVVDVNNNPANPVIGVRSFGEDPQQVARLGAAMVKGYQSAGIVSCLKHFPGHGDTAVDSHLALPTIPHTLERLETLELVPFRHGIEAGAESVMIAHVSFPALTQHDALPATLSSAIIQGLLRKQLGFNGMILSDCMDMKAISETFGTERAAVMALQAGIDLVLVSHHYTQQRESIEALLAAVLAGELSSQAVQQAAERVLKLKAGYLSWNDITTSTTDLACIGCEAHTQLQEQAYELSTTLVRNEDALLPLHLDPGEQIVILSPQRNTMTMVEDRYYSDDVLADIIKQHHTPVRIVPVAPGSVEDACGQLLQTSAIFIVATVNAHLDEQQAELVRYFISSGRRIIVIAVRNPYDLQAFPQLRTYLATYEYTRPALVAAVRVLFGERQAL